MNKSPFMRRQSARTLCNTFTASWRANAALAAILVLFAQALVWTDSARANSNYFPIATANYEFTLSPATANYITSNNDWSLVPSMEGFCGAGLTSTEGVDPRTVLAPDTDAPCVAANKSNPNAHNSGGIMEFDSGPYIAFGMQGNVTSDAPHIVIYVDTTGLSNVNVRFRAIDIDAGSNSSQSQVALQYRIGNTGNFANVPGAYNSDVTVGGSAGNTAIVQGILPSDADNQPQVQIRIITTNANGPDEWLGVNAFIAGNIVPSAAGVSVGGRAMTADGQGIRGAVVSLFSPAGDARTARTNGFGYYSFEDVEVGQNYIVSIAHRQYSFISSTRLVQVDDTVESLDFITVAEPVFFRR